MSDQQRWFKRLMTLMIRYSLVMTTLIGLSGCTSPIWKLVKPQKEKSHDVERIDLHRQETEFYHNKSPRDGRPKACLALSGGGLRSAAYSLGIMRALHETGILSKVDVISAVSGGSYALGWYYSQNIVDNGQLKNVFDSPEYLDRTIGSTEWVPLQDSILRGIVGFSPFSRVTVDEILGRTGWVSMWPRMVKPFSFLATTFYRGHRSVDGEVYENKIATTFFPRMKQTQKDGSVEEVIQTLQLKDLAQDIRKRGLPFFVVNATTHFDAKNEGDLPLRQRAFEFTPLYVGGDGVGWKPITNKDLDLNYFPKTLATVAYLHQTNCESRLA